MWFTLLICYIIATQPVKFLPTPLTSAYICLHIVDLLLKSARPINFLPSSPDMVQLRSKQTFARVQTHPASISDTSCMRPTSGKKGMAFTYISLQLYHKVLLLHGRILHTSQTCPACVLDACRRYLGAELYCNGLKLSEYKAYRLIDFLLINS